jgi:hypothetical protein
MLNKRGESVHSCLVPDFWGNCFSFFPFSKLLLICTLVTLSFFISVYYFYKGTSLRYFHTYT